MGRWPAKFEKNSREFPISESTGRLVGSESTKLWVFLLWKRENTQRSSKPKIWVIHLPPQLFQRPLSTRRPWHFPLANHPIHRSLPERKGSAISAKVHFSKRLSAGPSCNCFHRLVVMWPTHFCHLSAPSADRRLFLYEIVGFVFLLQISR
jgi:hypothetical protein